MAWNIKFPKDVKAKAAAQGKHVLALGYECGIRAEFMLYKTEDEIFIMSRLAHEMHDGSDPREAMERAIASLEQAKKDLAERKRQREEREAVASSA